MKRKSNLLESERTLELLREIGANPTLTQREMAKKFDVSLGKVNFLIRAFLEKGLIKVENFKKSHNKIGYIYILTPEGIDVRLKLTHKFFRRKLAEYEQLKREVESLRKENGEAYQFELQQAATAEKV